MNAGTILDFLIKNWFSPISSTPVKIRSVTLEVHVKTSCVYNI